MGFLTSFMLAGLLSFHPVHVSFTNVELDTVDHEISVSHKFFTDDFIMLFSHLFEKEIIPQQGKPFVNSEIKLINHYMRYRFNLVAGNDTIPLQYNGKDQDEESLWIRYSGKLVVPDADSIAVENMLLLDLYMDQTNLLIFNIADQEKGFAFNFEKRRWTMALKEY